MLGVAVRKLVTLPGPVLGTVCDLLEKMADPEWVEATKRFLRKENPWPVIQKIISDLLELIVTVNLPAVDSFRARDHFKVDTSGEVRIGWIGDNFCQVFLSGDGRVETDVPEATLNVYRLLKSSLDGPIIAELGEQIAEITLAQMFELLKRQGCGQQGVLITNGYTNVFYVRDAKGVLWAVGCLWVSGCGGWDVFAYSITDPDRWSGGLQVVSR